MFTYIELSNFKSFENVTFDFRQTEKKCKSFISIYGENGSGKSNFVSSVELLIMTLTSLSNSKRILALKELLEKKKDSGEPLDKLFADISLYIPMTTKLSEYNMIGNDGVSKAKYGFSIDGKRGYYEMCFTDEIVSETLYYITNKNKGELFSIKKENGEVNIKFSQYTFSDKKYEADIKKDIDMYWGKHTLLSILLNEQLEKNKSYIKSSISEHLVDVIDNFMKVFLLRKKTSIESIEMIVNPNVQFKDFSSIIIDMDDERQKKQLKLIEKIVRDFYLQAYSDIVDVFYEESESRRNDKKLRYKLYVKKRIAGQVRTIPFGLESSGTQSILSVLRAVLEAINGNTVIYDEIDSGIHDVLMRNILSSVQEDITGQLIITTHNTLLLESLDPKSVYVIYIDFNGNKEARCISDYGIRIQETNNMRDLFLKGIFGGVPYSSEIDYAKMHFDRQETEDVS